VVKSRFSFDKTHLSQAVASSLRDRLIECFNDTNQHYAVRLINQESIMFAYRTKIPREFITYRPSICKEE
jgi:hypothetical protein